MSLSAWRVTQIVLIGFSADARVGLSVADATSDGTYQYKIMMWDQRSGQEQLVPNETGCFTLS